MAKQFVKGNVYVFSFKKLKNSVKKESVKESRKWGNLINGNIVTISKTDSFLRYVGHVGHYRIVPKWCKCIRRGK